MGSSIPFSNVPLDSRSSSKSNSNRLKRSFALPIPYNISHYQGLGLSLKAAYQNLLDDESNNDNGAYFGNVNMNYGGVNSDLSPPDYQNTIDKKQASSHWVPNTTSPLPDTNNERRDANQDDRYTEKRGYAPFSGQGTVLSPDTSRKSIATQNLDNLQLGSSNPNVVQPEYQIPQDAISSPRPSVRNPAR